MELKKIGLLGGRGYAGKEILKVLSQHDFLKITSVFSTSKSGHQVDQAMDQSLIYQDLAKDKIRLSDEDAFILAHAKTVKIRDTVRARVPRSQLNHKHFEGARTSTADRRPRCHG